MKRYYTAIILFVILVALGGIATWDEWQTDKDNKEKDAKNALASLKVDDIQSIHYYNAEEGDKDKNSPSTVVDVNLVKKDNVWRLTTPVDSLADDKTVKSLLDAIKDYKTEKVVTNDRSKWKEYGLDPTKRSITFTYASGAKITVFIGEKAPVGYSVYSAADDPGRKDRTNEVYIGTQYLLASTAKSLHDFRDKTLVSIPEKEVKTFTYESSPHKTSRLGEKIELGRSDGVYKILFPEPLEADDREVKDFVEKINQIKVTEFMDTPDSTLKSVLSNDIVHTGEVKKDKAKAPSLQYKFSWTLESGSSEALRFAEYDGKFWAAFDPEKNVFRVSDELKGDLSKTVKNFRNRHVFSFDIEAANTVEIDGNQFKKVDGDWYAASDAEKALAISKDGKKTDGHKKDGKKDDSAPKFKPHVRSLLVDLEFAKAETLIKLDDSSLKTLPDSPLTTQPSNTVKIDFSEEDGKKPDSLLIEIWKKKGDENFFFVRRTGGQYLYEVPKSIVADLKEKPASDALKDNAKENLKDDLKLDDDEG